MKLFFSHLFVKMGFELITNKDVLGAKVIWNKYRCSDGLLAYVNAK